MFRVKDLVVYVEKYIGKGKEKDQCHDATQEDIDRLFSF